LAEVLPFRGLRYNRESVPDLAPVISPPYDIINASEQKRYHDKHPLNAIKLDFGIKLPGDSEADNRYSRAAATMQQWIYEKQLVPETRPAFYRCREEFLLPDRSTAFRDGFIAMIRLADFSTGIVLPHEKTASGPKQDRLSLMRATEANLSAIYCLFDDSDHSVIQTLGENGGDPDVRITDDSGTIHSLWVVDDPEVTAAVTSMFAEKTLLIADGHHRYETALAYRDARRREEGPGPDQPYDFVMVYLSDMENTGQSILPIHRFVSGLGNETLDQILPAMAEKFEVRELTGTAAERQREMISLMADADLEYNIFGMYLPASDRFVILTGRKSRPMYGASENDQSPEYRALDVAVLDSVILAEILGIRSGGANEAAKVRFVERTEKALAEIEEPGFDVAFFLNPTSMDEIRAVASAGETMPQKSTYFYPKPVTGLVFRSFCI